MTPVPMFHVGRVGHIEPAWAGDRFEGVQRTLAHGLHAQDVNVHVSADGHVVPGHYDKLRDNHIPHDGTIGGTDLAELRAMGVDPVTDWFQWAADNNFALMLEWKPDVHANDAVARLAWERVAAEVKRTGAKVAVMTIQAWAPRFTPNRPTRLAMWEAGAKVRMRVVRDVGLPTVLLWRRAVSPDWWDIVSAVKSAPRRVTLPHTVTRIGAGVQVPKARRRRRRRRHPIHHIRHHIRRRRRRRRHR